MDEAKKKYLEDLRKQIDPKVLEKMISSFANESEDQTATPTTPIPSSPSPHSPTQNLSPVEQIKQRRNSRFQESIAQIRMRNARDSAAKSEEPEIERTILILSSLNIWTKIVDTQFKSIGFAKSQSFSDFVSLIKHITQGLSDGTLGEFAVAVAFQEIVEFVKSWELLRRKIEGEKKAPFLDNIPFFFTVEVPRQINEQLIQIYGLDHFICLSDDTEVNSEKVTRILANYNKESDK